MREPVGRLDDLARARGPGDRAAIRTGGGAALTYDELDRLVNGCAAYLSRVAPVPGSTIAVASVLDPAFAVAYYGVLRAGHVVMPLIPLLREDALAHQLAAARVSVLFAPAELAARVAGIRDRLPLLRTVLDLAGEEVRSPLPDFTPAPVPSDGLACVQFTSGTTGLPRGIRQTHRNLAVNAAQTVRAHQLHEGSVTLNHLPTYHPMHLNSALHAGATQVLCTDPDPIASVELAERVRATRYYGLPVRLARLAADPRLAGTRLRTVEAINSGGSALAVPVTRALSHHFGIPVLQGYGLAETSPMTHCDQPDRPKPGSCGPLVADTECRIVDLETGKELTPGERGEIQVRGPQLMAGYLDEPDGAALDAEGWFATGDVGYTDDDGYLFVVDRLKDVFKCDNWLVAPSELEAVLRRHPAVADCVVLDYPEPFSGAVAVALVVPRTGADGTAADVSAVATEVNRDLPYYQWIRHVQAVPAIPRSPSGKVPRRQLRDEIRGRLKLEDLAPGAAPGAA
ncbi:class I adenylate-forming enzyme family protein [Nucisporomicrobium flavum]|uniref:class I adenylate-forming enzyme family protein n=1 Tax=Nucisporomicrobium flavum TaxID=2785915 RepID=UPI003C2B430A